MGILADHVFLKGLNTAELAYLKLAGYFFPFEKELLVSQGLSLIRNRITDKITYDALKDALKYDPYSIEMLAMYIQYANAYGKPDEVIKSYKILRQIGSNTNSFKEFEKTTKPHLPILKGL